MIAKKKLILGVVLLAAVAGGGWYVSVGKSGLGDSLKVSGTIEATNVRVSAQVGGTVQGVEVKEGQQVAKGQVLCRLDPTLYRLQAEQAQAALAGAEARLADLEAGARGQEIRQAQAAVEKLQAALAGAVKNLDYWEDNLAQKETLWEQGAISEQQRRDAQSQRDQAATQVQTVEADLAGARSRLALLQEGATSSALANLDAARSQAQKALELAQYNLDKAEVTAPVEGTVAIVSLEAGEWVNPGATVASILDLDHLWINVYVPETELGRLALGQEARVAVDAFPGETFGGEVTYIAGEAEFTPKNVQTEQDRVKTVFRVKVELKEGIGRLKPGMPADVYF